MSWAQYKQQAQSNAGGTGGKFIRFQNEGDLVEIVPLGDPGERWRKFDERTRKFTDAQPKEAGATCEVMINGYDVAAKEVRILSLDARDFAKLAEQVEANGEKAIYRIVRTSLKPKRFTVTMARKLTDAQFAKLPALDMHDLSEFGARSMAPAPAAAAAPAEPGSDLDEDLPF